MKYVLLVLLLSTASFSLAACKTTADTRNDRYSVDLNNDGYRDGGKCPPGHHMKGWC